MLDITPQQMVNALVSAGLSQNDIAELTGIAQSTVCRLFTGVHTDPRISTARAIEKLYLDLCEKPGA